MRTARCLQQIVKGAFANAVLRIDVSLPYLSVGKTCLYIDVINLVDVGNALGITLSLSLVHRIGFYLDDRFLSVWLNVKTHLAAYHHPACAFTLWAALLGEQLPRSVTSPTEGYFCGLYYFSFHVVSSFLGST